EGWRVGGLSCAAVLAGAGALAVSRQVRLDRPRRRLGMVQVEGRALGTDERDPVEVVPRRWAGRSPLEGSAVAPWIAGVDERRGLPGLDDVPDEHERGDGEEEGAHCADLVEELEAVLDEIVGVAALHAPDPEDVLDEERHV